MADFVKVAQLSEISPNTMKAIVVGDQEIALANIDGQIHAVDDICSHAECAISDGDIEGDELICPCHGSGFNVQTGAPSTPPARDPISVFQVKIEGDDIYVAV